MDKQQATPAPQTKGSHRRIRPKINQKQAQVVNTTSNANCNATTKTNDDPKGNQSEPGRHRRQKLKNNDQVRNGLNENDLKAKAHSSNANAEKAYSSRNIIASNFNQKGKPKQPNNQPKAKIFAQGFGSEEDDLNRSPLNYNTMIDEREIDDHIRPFLSKYGLDDARNYVNLLSPCFIRDIEDSTYCVLCCQRFDELISHDDHLAYPKHVDRFLSLRSKLLNMTPDPDSINMIALRHLLGSWIEENTLAEAHVEARISAIDDFNTIVAEINPSCQCRLIGSFLAENSLIDSDVNLELMHPNSELFQSDPRAKNSIHHQLVDPDADYGKQINNHTMHYDLISNAVDTLYKIATFIKHGYLSFNSFSLRKENFCLDLNAKVPKLVLLHQPTKVVLEIWCHAESSHQLACLLRNYMTLDERARELSVLVKKWARICGISNPEHGTFTPETFVIMVIHFLQRVEPPVLPCLHELFGKNDKKTKKHRDSSTENLDKIDKTNLSDSDTNEEQAKNSEAEAEANENTTDSANDANEEEVDCEEFTDSDFDQKTIDDLNWKSENLDPVHKLFVDFLKFSMDQFAHPQYVISIRTLKKYTVSDKKWFTQVKPIENPVRPSINLSKNIGAIRTANYIRSCFSHGYYYLTSLPMIEDLRRHPEPRPDPTGYIRLYINMKRFDFYFEMRQQKIERSKGDLTNEMVQQGLFARDVEVVKKLIEHAIIHGRPLDTIPMTVARHYDRRLLIPPDVASTYFCWLCRSFGHEKVLCPKGRVSTINNDEIDTSIDSLVVLDGGFLEMYVNDMIRMDTAKRHLRIVAELQKLICKGTKLDCKLELFGSTVNLLGNEDSDLDICMTLSGHPSGNGVNCVKILKKTCKVLRKIPQVRSTIEPVLAARVPIIKFKYGGFDIDLSMYNQCAIHNSQLLRKYVTLDPRVGQLCYLVKRYAKCCGIADASRGSLSSYAWSLLSIHFLQHTQPPVLPVLQESSQKNKPIFGVNGWNVWFDAEYDSTTQNLNDTPLTKLFKEFLLYYATFDFNQYVISIRTSKLITKFQKNWTYCMIAIEDPFELTYNLSGRLDDSMALYIMNSFPKAYKYVCQFQRNIQRKLRNFQETHPSVEITRTFFNGQAIMGCEPPNRGCRLCHRIGHRVRDCPARRPAKPAENANNGKTVPPITTWEARKDPKPKKPEKQGKPKSKQVVKLNQ